MAFQSIRDFPVEKGNIRDIFRGFSAGNGKSYSIASETRGRSKSESRSLACPSSGPEPPPDPAFAAAHGPPGADTEELELFETELLK